MAPLCWVQGAISNSGGPIPHPAGLGISLLMLVLILNNVVVWLVTTVTHSLATYFNRNCKTHILYAKCERKHRITHKIIFHVNISKHLSGTSIKLVAMDTANDKY